MARRLIEAGVKFVEVSLDGWDTHSNNFEQTERLLKVVDPAFAALVRDLEDRNLLDETIVLWLGEFGRTPTINENEGRDHFPNGWSAVIAGGGVRGGRAIGATNADGTAVVERPVSVPDLFASLCFALGIDYNNQNYSRAGRPIRVVNNGSSCKRIVRLKLCVTVFVVAPCSQKPWKGDRCIATPKPHAPTTMPFDLTKLARPEIAEMEAYTPILPFDVLSKRLGRSPEEIIKLDANENPYGPSPRIYGALATERYYHIYPDPDNNLLRDALSDYLSLDKSRIMVGHGADELIDLIMRLFIQPG